MRLNINKKGLLVIGLLAILAGSLIILLVPSKPTPNLTLSVSPMVSTILVDGKTKAGIGNIYLTPGAHKISASMKGFIDQSTTVTVVNNKLAVATLILVPTTDGMNWLAGHPSEALYRQNLAGKFVTEQTQNAITAAPLIKELPYIGAGLEFRIDYGSPTVGSNSPVIIITAPDVPSQQDAIAWMKARGYDSANYTIQYVTAQP